MTANATTKSLPWHITAHPAFPVGLLIAALLAALGLIVYLYRAQRCIAPTRTIAILTAIRLAELALLALLLFAPAIRWVKVDRSAGTLWLVLDHSASMAFKDAQARPVERLRWACRLKLIPSSVYTDSLDTTGARLELLDQQLIRLDRRFRRLNLIFSSSGRGRNVRVMEQIMQRWNGRLVKISSQLAGPSELGGIRVQLNSVQRMMAQAIRTLSTQAPGKQVAAPPFNAMLVDLKTQINQLASVANRQDRNFLAGHAHDVVVSSAMNRIAAMSRSQLARAILTRKGGKGLNFYSVISNRPTRLVSFAARASTRAGPQIGAIRAVLSAQLTPTGKATNISAGLAKLAQHLGPASHASVVLVSDGRRNFGPDPVEMARLLRARGVRTFTICIGSDQPVPAATIHSINAPTWIFKNQRIRAVAFVHLKELVGKSVTVELTRNGKVLQTRIITAQTPNESRRVRFSTRPPRPGVYRYAIRIPPLPETLTPHAVVRHFRVAVRRDKLRVLLVDNQPRWEYQYLVNYLSRNPRVKLQAILLHPIEIAGVTPPPPVIASPTNPSYIATGLPVGKAAWAAFDVIILGDVPPAAIPVLDQQSLASAVRNSGAALVLIAGGQYMPGSWRGSPLAGLMPVKLKRPSMGAVLANNSQDGFIPALAPEGIGAQVSQLAGEGQANSGIWQAMPRWYWHSPFTTARRQARVLWTMAPASGQAGATAQSDRHRALLASMSAGAGRVLYLASDQTWRLRYVHGQDVQNNFWSQVMRWAAGSELPAGGKYVRFGTDKSVYTFGQTVHLRAKVLSPDLLPDSHKTFRAVARRIASAAATRSGTDASRRQDSPMLHTPNAPGFYYGNLAGLEPGRYRITLHGAGIAHQLKNDPTAVVRQLIIRVRPQRNLELTDLSSDPAAMRRIALAGGGLMTAGPYANMLARRLPELSQTLRIPQQAGLFLHPHSGWTKFIHYLFLTLFAGLITLEWVLRKRAGLI